jgi:hypothetical protein
LLQTFNYPFSSQNDALGFHINQAKEPLILQNDTKEKNMFQSVKLQLAWKQERHIVNVGGLKNISPHHQLSSKGKILALTKK